MIASKNDLYFNGTYGNSACGQMKYGTRSIPRLLAVKGKCGERNLLASAFHGADYRAGIAIAVGEKQLFTS